MHAYTSESPAQQKSQRGSIVMNLFVGAAQVHGNRLVCQLPDPVQFGAKRDYIRLSTAAGLAGGRVRVARAG